MFHRSLNWTCPHRNWLTSHGNQLFSQGPLYLSEWDNPFSYPNWKSFVTPFLPISLPTEPYQFCSTFALELVCHLHLRSGHAWFREPSSLAWIHQFLPNPLFPVLSLLPSLPTYFLIYKPGYTSVQLNSLKWLLAAVRMQAIFLLGQ